MAYFDGPNGAGHYRHIKLSNAATANIITLMF